MLKGQLLLIGFATERPEIRFVGRRNTKKKVNINKEGNISIKKAKLEITVYEICKLVG